MSGKIVSETRGGAQRFFTHDALGSVVEVRDSAGTKTDSYTYWPYGEIRLFTGSTVNPWRFCGAWGYYFDGSSYYVRARQYRSDLTRWWTVDKFWPYEAAYEYCHLSPTTLYDVSGNVPCKPVCTPSVTVKKVSAKCEVKKSASTGKILMRVYKCMKAQCVMSCNEKANCGTCTMKQTYSDTLVVDGIERFRNVDKDDWKLPGNCPGTIWRYDAIGNHSGRTDIKQPCNEIKFTSEERAWPPILPVKYFAKYVTKCTCPGSAPSKAEFTFSFMIYESGGKLKCKFL